MAYTLQDVLKNEESTLRLYFDDIADSTPLSREKEVELSARIHAGDQEARDELVQANLRFVIDVAKNYQNRGLSLADLISAGNVGVSLCRVSSAWCGLTGMRSVAACAPTSPRASRSNTRIAASICRYESIARVMIK